MGVLSALFPFRRWFKEYSAVSLRADFIAGMTVALVLVLPSMAYAQLAGLPAYDGLYAAFLPPLIAALFGSSRQSATGPVAEDAIVFDGLPRVSIPHTSRSSLFDFLPLDPVMI